MHYPSAFDLIWSLPLAVILTVICRFLRNGALIKFGHYLGVPKRKSLQQTECHLLEAAYKQGFQLDHVSLEQLSKRSGMTPRQIEIWLRKRAKQDVPSEIQKFTESSWRFCIRLLAFVLGCCILSKKSWFWRTEHAWLDWPNHYVTSDVYWYYIFQLAIYLQFMFTLPTDNKRKDFILSVTHHVCTLILMCCGWMFNFVRIGTLVLLVNDAPDPWIEISKILVYSKRARFANFTFVVFVTVWILGKDVIYPMRLLKSTVFEAGQYLPLSTYIFVFFNAFLFIIAALNFLWTYNIFQVIRHKLRHGELKDVRSDSEADDDDNGNDKSK